MQLIKLLQLMQSQESVIALTPSQQSAAFIQYRLEELLQQSYAEQHENRPLVEPNISPVGEASRVPQQHMPLYVSSFTAGALSITSERRRLCKRSNVWVTPRVFSINTWLKLCYEDALMQGHCALRLLSHHQELFIWQSIIQQETVSEKIQPLMSPQKIAGAIAQAWALLQKWRIPLQAELFQCNLESSAFYHWASTFSALCQEHNWLSSAKLADILTALCQQISRPFALPHTLILLGCDEIPPQWKLLFQILSNQETKVIYNRLSPVKSEVKCLPLTNNEEEIRVMATWAKQIHLNCKQAYIVCAVPNLEELSAPIKREFHQSLTCNDPSIAFNCLTKAPLATHPLISCAFKILQLYYQPIKISLISQLLRSPFIGEAEVEMHQRALLDFFIHQQMEDRLSLPQFIALSKKNYLKGPQGAENTLTFCSRLQAIDIQIRAIKDQQAKFSPSQWLPILLHLLEIMGWPGQRNLSEAEYAAFEAWQQLLHAFSQCDEFCPLLNYEEAEKQLSAMAQETSFSKDNFKNNFPRLQVVSLAEAVNMPVDYLWVMNMHDSQWPSLACPNPFIPNVLQQQYKVPQAFAANTLSFCRTLTEHLSRNASQIIFSYPRQQGDTKLLASTLIKHYPQTDAYLSPSDYQDNNTALEHIEDYYAPPLTKKNSSGGSQLFKLQSLCPFRAFAELRLQAVKFERPLLGISAAERGSLLHTLLEIFWRQINSQAALHQLTAEALDACIEAVLTQYFTVLENTYNSVKKSFLIIEKVHLKKVLLKWLDYEKSRTPFIVYAVEDTRKIEFAGLSFTLKIDRIDRLPSGEYCIIDYKSSASSCSNWLDERLAEPQLPLYCITYPQPISAILFAEIKAAQLTFKGFIKQDSDGSFCFFPNHSKNIEEKNADTWNQQLIQWEHNLLKLAQNFQQGHAMIDPKDEFSACRHCHLEILCRKNDDTCPS